MMDYTDDYAMESHNEISQLVKDVLRTQTTNGRLNAEDCVKEIMDVLEREVVEADCEELIGACCEAILDFENEMKDTLSNRASRLFPRTMHEIRQGIKRELETRDMTDDREIYVTPEYEI